MPCPLTVATTLQFNPASVPDGAHQLRVFARDATGANVGYSASFPVTTSARGAINGTNGSDQVRLSVGVRRAVSAGHRAPTPHTTLDVPYNAKTVAQGRLVNSAGQAVTGARLTVATAVDRGVPTYADLPTDVVTDANGRFKVTLPRGPSWRVRVLYFARALDAAPAGRDDARVRVATHATFAPRRRHMRRGQRAVFRGHVVGSYRPAGIRVELQGRRRGKLRDARHGRHPERRHLSAELPLHRRRARALRVPPAGAPLPALPVLPGLLAPGERLRPLSPTRGPGAERARGS